MISGKVLDIFSSLFCHFVLSLWPSDDERVDIVQASEEDCQLIGQRQCCIVWSSSEQFETVLDIVKHFSTLFNEDYSVNGKQSEKCCKLSNSG